MQPSPSHKNYFLGLLTVLLLFSFVDRLALGVVLQDIKTEFRLSDTQLGLLSGIAFALFYSIIGIPIARWADRGNRVLIIALSALCWGIAVAACGFAASFVQLLLIRIVVAVGEAGCGPPSVSLLADYFRRAERPTAMAIYGSAGVLCALVGYVLAGWLNEQYGWRVTFMVLGAPGGVLAALAWLTLPEPRSASAGIRPASNELAAPALTQPTLAQVTRTLWGIVTFRHLLMCLAVHSFFAQGLMQWHVPFYIRSHGLTTAQIGLWLTIVFGVGGLLGAYLGGPWITRYAGQNERLQLRAFAVGLGVACACTVLVYLSPSAYLALALQGVSAVGLTFGFGPVNAAIQTMAPERMRAMSFALTGLCANLVGAGLGPLAVGALSDALRPWAGEESLRYALLAMAPGYLWAAWHAWRASRTVARDVAAADGPYFAPAQA